MNDGSAPSLFGFATANLALVVATGSLLIAAAGAFVAWRSYRRTTARLSAELTTGNIIGGGQSPRGTVSITVRNRGLVAVEVTQVSFQAKGQRDHFVAVDPPLGDEIPTTVQGLHSVAWHFPVLTIRTGTGSSKDQRSIRVAIHLGSGKRVRSKWMNLEEAHDRL